MAGFRLLDRVHGERPQGVREIRMGDASGGGFGHERFQKDGGRAPVRAPGQGRRLVSMGLSRVNFSGRRQQDRIAAPKSAP